MKFGWKINASPDKLAGFQDWHAEHHLDRFFSNVYGASILRELKRYATLSSAIVIDYGAGPGFLTKKLIREGAKVYAVDISKESLKILKENNPDIAGIIHSGSGGSLAEADIADVVVLVETVEHLSDELRDEIINDIYRLLKPGGKLFLTCPNDENLDAAMVCCPNCGGAFHPVLHLKTYSASSIEKVIKKYGFSDVFSRATNWSLSKYPYLFVLILYRLIGRKLPHLYCVATK